jgi:hypothetical protein
MADNMTIDRIFVLDSKIANPMKKREKMKIRILLSALKYRNKRNKARARLISEILFIVSTYDLIFNPRADYL